MNLSTTHIVFIAQSILILVLFFVVIFKKSPNPIPFDYDRIKEDMQKSIESLEKEFLLLSEENFILYNKIDSLKNKIPNTENSLRKINEEIKRLNEKYTVSDYRDSSDVALIRRLSRGINR